MRVALFVTCVCDTLFPEVGKATVQLLERLGVDVDFPAEQTCCGQMHANTGYRREVLPMARRLLTALAPYDAAVGPSGSCVGMVREHYPDLARELGDPEFSRLVADVAPKVYELTEFVCDVLGRDDVGAYYPHRVTYHPSCHSLRLLRIGDRPYRLLRAVRGLDLVDLPRADECCGFGGTFALKNADTSVAMVSDKVRHILETGAEIVTSADSSCLMNIDGALSRLNTGVRAVHLAEILASEEN